MVEYEQLQPWKEKNAVILEVNSPLGGTIAEKLLKMDMFVFGIDIDRNYVESVRQHKNFKFIKADLRKEDDILEIFQFITIKYGGADMFINIMKISKSTSFLDSDNLEWWDLFDRYIVGYMLSIREMLRSLADRKVELGQIVNIINRSQHRLHQILKRTLNVLTKYLDQETNPRMDYVRISTVSNVIEKFEERQLRNGVTPSQFADAVEFVIGMPLHVQVRNIDLEAV